MLTIQDLCATAGQSFSIEGLSLSVAAGERVAVLGPNGSGKSFLLRLIVGLETPRAGTISWAGGLLSGPGRVAVPPDERSMGILFQDVALFPNLDVRGNVALGVPRSTPGPASRSLVERALETAQVAGLSSRSVLELSGGEQQRVALARALARRPAVLLLDEPFHSLDGPVKRGILSQLGAIVREERIATILVTHDTEEAADFSERVVMLRNGRKIQEGTFEEIYDAPADEAAASFLGPVEALEVEQARRSGIELPPGSGEGPVFFRPEHLLLTPLAGGALEGLTVTRTRARGSLREVTVALADGTEIWASSMAESAPRRGERVSARVAKALAWHACSERGR